MEQNLEGYCAIITGGAQGIGKACAQRLLQQGAQIGIWDHDQALGEKSATELCAFGQAHFQRCDITDWQDVLRAAKSSEAQMGKIDILVNSAGIAGANAPVSEYDLGEFRKVTEVNLYGTFHTNKVVIDSMKARNFGRIVNIASIAGKEGNPNACAYSASKAAVIGFTKSLGKELAGYDIGVNCITPAAARTAIFDQMSEEHISYMLSKIPRGRFLEIDEAAAMVSWLVSPENSFTTAAVFDLSGGRATY